jgi:NADH:ubiquinone oxidoreductase subunit 4 (subunit M)
MAHVEAPTFGSMVLAGVLLKLGGAGLIRCLSLVSVDLLKSVLIGYLFVFMCFVTLICCIQSDFKRLVAYSSVSHMIGVPVMLVSSSFIGIKGLLVVMFIHGISSPILFMFVGVMYSFTSTRQHFLMRGLLTVRPILSFFITLTFFFTLSAPPFPSFVSEVFLVVCSIGV